jgi:hypothetical protein
MQATQHRTGEYATNGLDGARHRRVLIQGQVRARPIVVIQIRPQQMTEMALAKDNHVVNAFPPDRPSLALVWREKDFAIINDRRPPWPVRHSGSANVFRETRHNETNRQKLPTSCSVFIQVVGAERAMVVCFGSPGLASFMSIGRPANSLNQFICDFLRAKFEGNGVPVRQLWAKGGKSLRFDPAQHKEHSLCH